MVNWPVVGGIGGVVSAAAGLILGYMVFPPVLMGTIFKKVVIMNGTDQFNLWAQLPQPLEVKIYFFNVTNVQEVQNGGTPKVVEVGPYIYYKFLKKFDIKFAPTLDKVTYYQRQTYFYNENATLPLKQDDKITILNMHVNTILTILDDQITNLRKNSGKNIRNNLFFQTILQAVESESVDLMGFLDSEMVGIFGPDTTSMFIETTPRKFLFEGEEFCTNKGGIPGVVCNQIKSRKTSTIRQTSSGSLKFSLFRHRNNSHDGLYQINTGLFDFTKLMQIEKWESKATVDYWNNDKSGKISSCNKIQGSDASGYPPFIKAGESLFIFNTEMCRSLKLFFDSATSFKGIPAFSYSTQNFLNKIGPNFNSSCYCINKIEKALMQNDNGCLYPGALDMTSCIGAPVILTLPHLLDSDDHYSKLIDGLVPNSDAHKIELFIEPNTGVPLKVKIRLQFNMFLRKIKGITITKNLKSNLFPVLWVEQGLELNDVIADVIKKDLVKFLQILDIIQWGLVFIGAVISIASVGNYFFKQKNKTLSASVEPIFKD